MNLEVSDRIFRVEDSTQEPWPQGFLAVNTFAFSPLQSAMLWLFSRFPEAFTGANQGFFRGVPDTAGANFHGRIVT
ncbi:hypothetical protein BK816_06750 [Boudabousia tangfeifanii]|uniref:Uncharacterized protein n=1 Tax=Boudabousia tangfeifanii TaxID=1912795 RepID=A0A1D9ML50_9ACTO|nr:hypothetical protein BK816_06750 [Boudabousia tangfeifanii]